jgi:hypothetical protein
MRNLVIVSSIVTATLLMQTTAANPTDRSKEISQFVVAKISLRDNEVKKISQSVTVKIDLQNTFNPGSGVIVHRQDDLYTVITNRHVVCGATKQRVCSQLPSKEIYTLTLPDGKQHRLSTDSIKLLGDKLDLAMVQFRSDRTYAVAKLADPRTLKSSDQIYVGGYPGSSKQFLFSQGTVFAATRKRIDGDKGGYTVIHDAETARGMSGGGIFDSEGKLVAIHGQGDRVTDSTQTEDRTTAVLSPIRVATGVKIGSGRGVSTHWMILGLAVQGIRLSDGSTSQNNSVSEQSELNTEKADEYLIIGYSKLINPGDDVVAGKREALKNLDQALKLNPKYIPIYILKAYAHVQLNELKLALETYEQALSHNPPANLAANIYNDRGGAIKSEVFLLSRAGRQIHPVFTPVLVGPQHP